MDDKIIFVYLNTLQKFELSDGWLYSKWLLNPFTLLKTLSSFIKKKNVFKRVFIKNAQYLKEYDEINVGSDEVSKDFALALINTCHYLKDNYSASWVRKLYFQFEFAPEFDDLIKFVNSNETILRAKGKLFSSKIIMLIYYNTFF